MHVPSGKHIKAMLIEPNNAFWQIRLDQDDNMIYTLHPNNAPESDHLDFKKGFSMMEWRIKPGQGISNGKVRWELSRIRPE